MKIGNYTLKPIDALFVLFPLAVIGARAHWSSTLVFALSALSVIPLAGLMGHATEELALHVGPKIGGLLNATLGNAAELIITIFAIRAGLLELVLASITGSVLGNLLLILGLSLLLGGLKHGNQKFDAHQAGVNSTMTLMSLAGLAVPSLFIAHFGEMSESLAVAEAAERGVQALSSFEAAEFLSLGAAVLLMVIYALSIVYGFTRETGADHAAIEPEHHATWTVAGSAVALVLSTAGIAWMSEILVHAVEPATAALGWSQFFVGIIIIPLVGNVAEHLVAVQVALKNKMELSLAISLGSSLQIALFVAPLLVFISLAMGNPMQLTFNLFEITALMAAAVLAAFVAQDGESNWLEGAILLVLYALLGVAFFYVR